MTKQKSSAQILVADGAGGLRPVEDLRFSEGDWPINLAVPASDAHDWMLHLAAESEERGWSLNSFTQLDAAENSGTLALQTSSGPSPPTLHMIWEKLRNGELRVRARPSDEPTFPLETARGFCDAVTTRQRYRKTDRAHRRELLTYDGLPWKGELWLSDQLRLGPPSKHPDSLLGSQVVILDATVDGIGPQGIDASFHQLVQELRVFMSFVLGIRPGLSRLRYEWVPDLRPDGTIADCLLKSVGYIEVAASPGFPARGSARPVERRTVKRPGLGPYGIHSDMTEEWVPDDIEELWRIFSELPHSKRDNLLRAGNAHLLAKSMWPEQRTAYVAFMVVACEALKPPGRRHDSMNVYDVVTSLLGHTTAESLRQLTVHPQKVRSKHLHRGELAADELVPMFTHDFKDPSFDEMLRHLASVSRLCLIEWLRCRGQYDVRRLPREKRNRLAAVSTLLRFLTRQAAFFAKRVHAKLASHMWSRPERSKR